MLNYIVMMGRLTHDPELRHTQAGDAVCTIRIACDRDYKTKDGEKETDFVDVVAWRKLAETTAKYFTKGRMAVVEGRLQIRPWTDNDGNKRYATEIVANHVRFGDSKPKGEDGGGGGAGYGEPPAAAEPPEGWVPSFSEEDDGDLPF